MEEELYTLLSGAVSFPVAWGSHSDDTGLPRASMWMTSGIRDMNTKSLGLMTSRVQIDCYGVTQLAAITASRAIRDTLEGYQGGVIQGAFLESTRDSEANDAGLVPYRSTTFSITYRD